MLYRVRWRNPVLHVTVEMVLTYQGDSPWGDVLLFEESTGQVVGVPRSWIEDMEVLT